MTDKQPEALIVADALTCEASFDIHHLAIKAMKEGAALLRTQHAAIERKDALLRQALAVLNTAYGDGLEADKEIESVYESITSELAK